MKNAREFVFDLLISMDKKGSYSNIALDNALLKSGLGVKDKRFATALFYGVIERRITLDHIISSQCSRPCEKLSPKALEALRIALYQILYMDSVPDSAAVNESVNLLKKDRNKALPGFVNGVLRSFLRSGKKLPEVQNRLKRLSVLYSCPEWLISKWESEYGEETATKMLEYSLAAPPVTVRINSAAGDCDGILKELLDCGVEYKTVEGIPFCAELFGVGAVEELSAYKKGLFHVQDISSQLCCKALGAKPGDTVIDVCAAPGGKTFTIAEDMRDKGRLISCDIYESRTRLIFDGAKRLGLSCIETSVNDAAVYNDSFPCADKVLCDVPCSGLGVIRRKPEIKYKSEASFKGLSDIQRSILSASAKYVKPGGILVYSTCTLSREENDDNAEWFLKNHRNFSPCEIEGMSQSGRVTIVPGEYNCDGFFIAKFKRHKV